MSLLSVRLLSLYFVFATDLNVIVVVSDHFNNIGLEMQILKMNSVDVTIKVTHARRDLYPAHNLCLCASGPFNQIKSSLLGSTSDSNLTKYSTINKIPLITLNFSETNNDKRASSPHSSEKTIIAPKVKDRTHNVTDKVTQVRDIYYYKCSTQTKWSQQSALTKGY